MTMRPRVTVTLTFCSRLKAASFIAAAGSLKAYLKQGGKLLSLGGYAFSRQVIRENGKWVPAPKPWELLGTERLLRVGDYLEYGTDQLPIFSLDDPLQNAERITASDQ